MNSNDIFILSNGHAVVALYVILEKYYGLNAQELLDKYGSILKEMNWIKFSVQLEVLGWVLLLL